MGMRLPDLERKLAATSFYPGLFAAAFGDSAVTSDRVSKALAQFVRSLVSAGSKYDRALADGPAPALSDAIGVTAQQFRPPAPPAVAVAAEEDAPVRRS